MMARIGIVLILISLSLFNKAQALVVEELDGAPQVLDVNRMIFNGFTLTNLGSKKVKIQSISSGGGGGGGGNGGTLGSINNGNALISIANGTGYYTTITPVTTLSSYTNNLNWSSESNGGTMRSIQPTGDNGIAFNVTSLSGNGGSLRATLDTSLFQAANGNLTTWSNKSVPSGVVVGTTDTQTLTNKTLQAATLNGITIIDNIRAKTTAGTLFESLGGTDIANFGVANTANVSFNAGVSMVTATFNGNSMTLPTLGQGSLLYAKSSGVLKELAKGTNHYALKVNGNTLAWEADNTGGGGGASNIDGLSDAKANATTIYIGNGSGASDTMSGASYSTSIGVQTLRVNNNAAGLRNTGVGYQVLYNNTNGDDNTATGYQALFNNTNGQYNITSGYRSLYSNTSGKYNVGFGYFSGYLNQTGSNNTQAGAYSLYNNVAKDNTCFGYFCGYSNTSGANGTAMGQNAMWSNTTGRNNVAIGARASYFNSTGSRNVALGFNAGEGNGSNSFSNGTSLGYNAGAGLTTGHSNILIGYNAGDALTSGSSNIVIGRDIEAISNTASGQITIGNLIYGNGALATGTTVSSGKVGIRKSNPAYTFDVNGSTFTKNFTMNGNSFVASTLAQGSLLVAQANGSIRELAKGTNHYALKVNGNRLAWEPAASGGGSTSPGGSNTQFQFNDSGSFGGNGALTFTKASKTLTIPSDAPFKINSTGLAIADTDITLNGSTTTFTQTTGAITVTPKANNNLNEYLSYNGKALIRNSTNSVVAILQGTTRQEMVGSVMNTIWGDSTIRFKEDDQVGFIPHIWTMGQYANGDKFMVAEGSRLASSRFTINTGGNVGISTDTPAAKLEVNAAGLTPSSSMYTSDNLIVTGATNTAPGFNILTAGSSASNRGVFKATRARGTVAAPTTVTDGDQTFSLLGAGHDGTNSIASAGITMRVNGTVSTGSVPQSIDFETAASGSRTTKMRILSDGRVGIGVGSPTAQLQVHAGSSSTLVSTFRAASAQSSHLTSWQSSAPSTLSFIDNGGRFNIGDATRKTGFNLDVNGAMFAKRINLNGTDLTAGGGSGDVTGGSSSAINGVPLFSATTGKAIKYDPNFRMVSRSANSIYIGNGAGAAANGTTLQNTALGFNALTGGTSFTGDANTAVGYDAGRVITTGSNNTFLGTQAGEGILTGSSNTLIGQNAMQSNNEFNVSGSFNTCVGARCFLGAYSVTNGNTAVGYNTGALGSFATASRNTLLGYQAGNNLTSGNNNIVIGYDIDTPVASGSNSLTIGNLIYGNGLTAIGTAVSSGKVGIKQPRPNFDLDVNGSIETIGLAVTNGAYSTQLISLGNGGTTESINCTKGMNFALTLNATTLNPLKFNPKPLGPTGITLYLTQGTGGSKTVTWNGNISWPAATAPTLSTTAGKIDMVNCRYQGSTTGKFFCTYALGY